MFVIGLKREAALLTMDIALDVEVVDLRHAEQQVCGGG